MRVIIESPYRGETTEDTVSNIRYGRACLRDSLMRGEACFASHLFYTQPGVLADGNETERAQGINAGYAWMETAEKVVFYVDRGMSLGMKDALDVTIHYGLEIEFRRIEAQDCLTWRGDLHQAQAVQEMTNYTPETSPPRPEPSEPCKKGG
jgi:hypothetical protein